MHLPGQCRELTAGFWRRGTSGGQSGTGKGREGHVQATDQVKNILDLKSCFQIEKTVDLVGTEHDFPSLSIFIFLRM